MGEALRVTPSLIKEGVGGGKKTAGLSLTDNQAARRFAKKKRHYSSIKISGHKKGASGKSHHRPRTRNGEYRALPTPKPNPTVAASGKQSG